MEKQIIEIDKHNKMNYMGILIGLSILMISVFPILGSNGWKIQNIVIWTTIFVGIFYNAFKDGLVVNKFLFIYAFYIGFSIISIIWVSNYGGAYIRIMDMLKSFLFLLVLSSNCKEKKDIFKYLNIFTLGVVIISAYCIIIDASNLRTWARLGRESFEIAGQNQIYYSCILIYSTMYSLFKVFYKKGNRIINIIVMLFLFLCGILTAIRKCLIIPLIFIMFYMAIKNKKNIIKLFVVGIVTFACISAVYIVNLKFFPSMSNRMISMIEDFSNNTEGNVNGNSFSSRKWLREKAWKVFLQHPIKGVGIGQFRFYAAREGVDLYSHNNFLEILANTGIIGFVIYYWNYLILICGLINLHKKNNISNKEYVFMISFMLASLIMEYGQVEYYQLYFLFFLNLFSMYINHNKFLIYYNKR